MKPFKNRPKMFAVPKKEQICVYDSGGVASAIADVFLGPMSSSPSLMI